MVGKRAKKAAIKRKAQGLKQLPKQPPLLLMSGAIALVSLVEVVLVFLGIIPPILSYSPANLLFTLARIAIIAYTGVVYAKNGIAKCAIDGALVGLVGALIICVAAAVNFRLLHMVLLGIIVWNVEGMLALLANMLFWNALVGAIVAAAASEIARRCCR